MSFSLLSFFFLFSFFVLSMSNSLNCNERKKNATSKQNFVVCDLCSPTFHKKCLGSNSLLNKNTSISANYICQACAHVVFVFHSLSSKELQKEFNADFEINSLLLNEIFTDPEHVNDCDVDCGGDNEINSNLLKDDYVSTEKVNSFLMTDNPKEIMTNSYQFSTLCINARSIVKPTNFTEIEGLIALFDHKLDVIGITETWKQPNSFGQYNCLPEHTFVSNGGINHKSGGVGMYGKSSLNFHVCNDFYCNK